MAGLEGEAQERARTPQPLGFCKPAIDVLSTAPFQHLRNGGPCPRDTRATCAPRSMESQSHAGETHQQRSQPCRKQGGRSARPGPKHAELLRATSEGRIATESSSERRRAVDRRSRNPGGGDRQQGCLALWCAQPWLGDHLAFRADCFPGYSHPCSFALRASKSARGHANAWSP